MMKIVGLASLYEPLEFLENRIRNLNQCDMEDVLVHWADCSSEGTWKEVERIIKEKCRFSYRVDHLPERKTLYWTWNWIIGENKDALYYTNINVDDIYRPEYFKKMAEYLDKNPGTTIVACPWFVTDLKGQIWPVSVAGKPSIPSPTTTLGHFPMWRSSIHSDAGLFDPRMVAIGDSDFWGRVRIIKGTESMAIYPDVLACYLSHGNNLYNSKCGGQSAEGHDRDLRDGNRQKETWIDQVLTRLENDPVIFELGSRHGEDSIFLSAVSSTTGKNSIIYAFEPDPRNVEHVAVRVKLPGNVRFIPKAVSNFDGESRLYLSEKNDGEWTYSSSLLCPKEHLKEYHFVKFKKEATVQVTRLDTFCQRNGIKKVSFLWMDIQGSERHAFEGAGKLLDETRFMYVEAENKEMYEGQWTAREMVKTLSGSWGVARIFSNDILFYNRKFYKTNPISIQ